MNFDSLDNFYKTLTGTPSIVTLREPCFSQKNKRCTKVSDIFITLCGTQQDDWSISNFSLRKKIYEDLWQEMNHDELHLNMGTGECYNTMSYSPADRKLITSELWIRQQQWVISRLKRLGIPFILERTYSKKTLKKADPKLHEKLKDIEWRKSFVIGRGFSDNVRDRMFPGFNLYLYKDDDHSMKMYSEIPDVLHLRTNEFVRVTFLQNVF